MTKPILIFVLSLLVSAHFSLAALWPGEKPKLVVVIVIDQFRADYLSRYQNQFSENGFKALMKNGAHFPFGEYDILQSMTAPGHGTILTGAYPYQMGIPINDWYDHRTQSDVYCVEDKDSALVGVDANSKDPGVSPKNLIGTTVGDELKNIDSQSKMIALALKDRAAVLMGGHRADLAFWYDNNAAQWVSSKYYLSTGALPPWMNKLNEQVKKTKCDQSQACGIDQTLQAFQAALEHEKMGQSAGTDILAVSFSSHDYAGHRHGPNSNEMLPMTLAEDKAIEQMRKLINQHVQGGLQKTVFVLTADHGVAPAPEYLKSRRIETGNIDEEAIMQDINTVLNKKYGKIKSGKWVRHVTDFNFYLDEEAVQSAKTPEAIIQKDAKDVLLKHPGFAQAFTQSEYESGQLPPGMFARQIKKTFFRGRSGQVIGIPKPFYINKTRSKATHMTGYSYDRTVPIVFSGFGIRPGVYAEKAEVIDIAPTLSFMLGVLPPALSEGRVLKEALNIAQQKK